MYSFRSNPPSRQIQPRPELLPSSRHMNTVREGGAYAMLEWLLGATGMTPSTLGRTIANDPRLVFDMRNGRRPGSATLNAIADMHRAIRQQREVCHA